MRKSIWVSTLLLVLATVLILPPGCAKPAQFEVMSLDVAPSQANAGESVTVTAEVKNVGGSEGVYAAVLTVDGAQVETKNVTLAPEATETVTFSLVKDKAGTYQVAIGDMSSSLTVKPKLVVKEVELGYDDGTGTTRYLDVGFLQSPLFQNNGYLIGFTPSYTPFIIKKVALYVAIIH